MDGGASFFLLSLLKSIFIVRLRLSSYMIWHVIGCAEQTSVGFYLCGDQFASWTIECLMQKGVFDYILTVQVIEKYILKLLLLFSVEWSSILVRIWIEMRWVHRRIGLYTFVVWWCEWLFTFILILSSNLPSMDCISSHGGKTHFQTFLTLIFGGFAWIGVPNEFVVTTIAIYESCIPYCSWSFNSKLPSSINDWSLICKQHGDCNVLHRM